MTTLPTKLLWVQCPCCGKQAQLSTLISEFWPSMDDTVRAIAFHDPHTILQAYWGEE